MVAAFIPAWKRLGLQLKNSHNASDSSSSVPAQAQSGAHKRKFDNRQNNNTPSHPNKLQKVQPDFKAAEGHSNQSKPSIIKFDDASVDSSANDHSFATRRPQEAPKSHDKQHRSKVSASKTKAPPSQRPKQRPYLAYLDSFYNSRDTWKFNKANQSKLLREVFKPFRIPAEYDAALASYIRGLQSHTAQAKLREEAMAILAEPQSLEQVSNDSTAETVTKSAKTNPSSIDDAKLLEEDRRRGAEMDEAERIAAKIDKDTVKRAATGEALKLEENTKEFQIKMRKRKLADTILAALDDANRKASNPGSSQQRIPQSSMKSSNQSNFVNSHTHIEKPSARKRRKRTGVPDDDYVSDSDESGSDEEDEQPVGGSQTTNAAENGEGTDDDSDSDGDSESSSEEE